MKFLQFGLVCVVVLVHGSAAGQGITYCTFSRDLDVVFARCTASQHYSGNFCATASADSPRDTRNLIPLNAFRQCVSVSECPTNYSCVTFAIPELAAIGAPGTTTSVCLPTSCEVPLGSDRNVSRATFDACFLNAAGGDYSLSQFLAGRCDPNGEENGSETCSNTAPNYASRNGCAGGTFSCGPTCDQPNDDDRCPACAACLSAAEAPTCMTGCSKYCPIRIDASVSLPADSGARADGWLNNPADATVNRVDAAVAVRPNVACTLVSAEPSPPVAFCADVCGPDSCASPVDGTCVNEVYPLVGSFSACPASTYAIPSLATAGPAALCVPRGLLHCPGEPVADGSLRARVISCFTNPETGATVSWSFGDCDGDGIPNHCDPSTFTPSVTSTGCSTIGIICDSRAEPQGCRPAMDGGVRDAGSDSGPVPITDAHVGLRDSSVPRDAPATDTLADSSLPRDAVGAVMDTQTADAGAGFDSGSDDATVAGPDAADNVAQGPPELITGGCSCSVGSRGSRSSHSAATLLLLGGLIGLRFRRRSMHAARASRACSTMLLLVSLVGAVPAANAQPLDADVSVIIGRDAGFASDIGCGAPTPPTVPVCYTYNANNCSIAPTPGATCACAASAGFTAGVCSPSGTCSCLADAGWSDAWRGPTDAAQDASNLGAYACALRSAMGGLTVANLNCQPVTCLLDGQCRAPSSACRSEKYPLAVGAVINDGLVSCPEPGQVGVLTSLSFPQVLCVDPAFYVCPGALPRTISNELLARVTACHTSPAGATPVIWGRGDCDGDGTPNECDPFTFIASTPTVVCTTPTPVPGAPCVTHAARCPGPADAGAQDAQTADVQVPIDAPSTIDGTGPDAAATDSGVIVHDSFSPILDVRADLPVATGDANLADAGVSADASALDAGGHGADSAIDPDPSLPNQPEEVITGGCSVANAANHGARDAGAGLLGAAAILAAVLARSDSRRKRRSIATRSGHE